MKVHDMGRQATVSMLTIQRNVVDAVDFDARSRRPLSARISGGHVTVTSSISLNASAAARAHTHTSWRP